MPSWSASHWLVRPWRRSSSRIRLPMCICMIAISYITGSVPAYHVMLPIPCIISNDHRQKRRRAISSPNCGRRKYLLRIDKMLADKRAFAHLFSVKFTFEIFDVSVRSEQIANAMLLIVFVCYGLYLCHVFNVDLDLQKYKRFAFYYPLCRISISCTSNFVIFNPNRIL